MKNLDIFVSNGFDIMAAICLDFKWLGFRISDPFQDLDNFQTNFFSAISNADLIRFQIPTLSQNKQNELHPSVFCFTSSNKYSQKLIFLESFIEYLLVVYVWVFRDQCLVGFGSCAPGPPWPLY